MNIYGREDRKDVVDHLFTLDSSMLHYINHIRLYFRDRRTHLKVIKEGGGWRLVPDTWTEKK